MAQKPKPGAKRPTCATIHHDPRPTRPFYGFKLRTTTYVLWNDSQPEQ